MCGIFGIVEREGPVTAERDLRERLGAMARALIHRGPDDGGLALHRTGLATVALGIRRLSIIDVAGGRQPMTNEDGSVSLVCNGEIYNYRELRAELAAKGHRFRTRSDVEVIVHLYEEQGPDCVSRLRGMFAFALWDHRASVLLLARDRLGIKPLLYHEDGRRLAFASELRGLLPAFEEVPALRRDALLRLLMLQYLPAPDTAFVGIQKLLPGTLLLVGEQGLESRRYWRPPAIDGREDRPAEDLSRAVAVALREAVTSHLVSDVPLGAFLSGGVDSTSVVALMSRAGLGRFSTFSVGFEDQPAYTELSYARQVAERFGTVHHELMVGPKEVMASLPKLIDHLDEPLADPAIVPTSLLSGLAAQSVKVVLTGEGADELFGGYRRYALDRLATWYRAVPSSLRRRVASWLRRSPVRRRVVQGAMALSHSSPSRRHLDWVSTCTSEELLELAADPGAAAREEEEVQRLFRVYFEDGHAEDSALAGMLRADLATWLPDDLLTKVDRMSMASSLEARVPYLDHPLVELAMRIPASLNIGCGGRKAVLKAAVADLVPPAILNRPKMGLDLPLASWMRGPLRDFMADLLALDGPPGLFNRTAVERFRDQHQRGEQDRGRQLWTIAMIKLWYRTVLNEPRSRGDGCCC